MPKSVRVPARKAATKRLPPQVTADPVGEQMPEVVARDTLRVVLRPIDGLIPYARNARTHSAEQVAQLAGSITEFGWTNPVLADDGGIVAGHGRVMAARVIYDKGRAIKLPDGTELPVGMVPVIDCTGWSEQKRRAYILADNKLALNAGWDIELLSGELKELEGSGVTLSLLGFSDDDLLRLNDDLASAALAAAAADTAGDGAEAQHEGSESAGGFVTFAVPLTANDRRFVLDALAVAKTRFSVEGTGDALVQMARDFVSRNT